MVNSATAIAYLPLLTFTLKQLDIYPYKKTFLDFNSSITSTGYILCYNCFSISSLTYYYCSLYISLALLSPFVSLSIISLS